MLRLGPRAKPPAPRRREARGAGRGDPTAQLVDAGLREADRCRPNRTRPTHRTHHLHRDLLQIPLAQAASTYERLGLTLV